MDVVYKKGSSWFTGTFKDYKLRKKKQINKLSDVKDTANYITLKKWLSTNKCEYTFDDLISKLKVQSFYIKVDETEQNTRSISNMTEKKFWSRFNEICKKCVHPCKQSSYADIIICNRRETIKK